MYQPSEQRPPAPPEPPQPIRWRIWPVRDAPLRGLTVVAVLLAAGGVIGWLSGKVYLGALAAAALAAALWRFFLPVTFELSGQGIGQSFLGRQRSIPWHAIRSYEIRSAGVLLWPQDDRSAMPSLCAIYLPWTTHQGEILAHLHHYLVQSR